ncbi:MAG TPA: hypothetical protein PKL97_02105 [Candidatus Omnitrophota bacterium]|nr:hypothetical protein [Candidatus Omnitrophota bacterium]
MAGGDDRKIRPEGERSPEEWAKELKSFQDDLGYHRKHLDKLWEQATEARERLQDLEIQVNLVTRLLTTICLEVLKIPQKTFRGIVRQIEKEAERDSQVVHLEELFRLESKKKEGEEDKRKEP